LPSLLGSLCENAVRPVIPSGARNLALSLFKAMRDSSSSATKNGGLLGMTCKLGFSHRLLGRGWLAPALSPAGASWVRGHSRCPAVGADCVFIVLQPRVSWRWVDACGFPVARDRSLFFRSCEKVHEGKKGSRKGAKHAKAAKGRSDLRSALLCGLVRRPTEPSAGPFGGMADPRGHSPNPASGRAGE
jgi:hypothetical protein